MKDASYVPTVSDLVAMIATVGPTTIGGALRKLRTPTDTRRGLLLPMETVCLSEGFLRRRRGQNVSGPNAVSTLFEVTEKGRRMVEQIGTTPQGSHWVGRFV